MRGDLQPRITNGPEWKGGIIKIQKIGIKAIDEVDRAVIEFLAVFVRRNGGAIVPVPLAPKRPDIFFASSAQGVVLGV